MAEEIRSTDLKIINHSKRAQIYQGAVPTNTTSNVLRTGDENAWHHLPHITALAALAALLHDLGKATQAFQDKLKNPGLRERNHYRHEWVSVRLFQAFVGQDDDAGWLQRLADCAAPGTDAKAFEALWLDHASVKGPWSSASAMRCRVAASWARVASSANQRGEWARLPLEMGSVWPSAVRTPSSEAPMKGRNRGRSVLSTTNSPVPEWRH